MMRLIGILTGSAIAAALFIFALGLPELRLPGSGTGVPPPADPETEVVLQAGQDPVAETDPVAVAANQKPLPGVPATQAVSERHRDPVAEIESAAIAADNEPPAAFVAPVAARPDRESEPGILIEEITTPVEQRLAEQRWYAFWSPFRSQFAADGFVSQLQRSTGLDYRVVKLKPGIYEVAFAYSDDSDIEAKLTQISSATGLDLSGG